MIWMAGCPSPPPVACNKRLANLIVLAALCAREGDSGLRADFAVDSEDPGPSEKRSQG